MAETILADGAGKETETEMFIRSLMELSTGDLAALKRNAGNTIGESRGAAGVFYRILPRSVAGRYREEIYFLIATLFGLNKYAFAGDFGATMRAVKQKTGTENTDRRMAIILDCVFGAVDGGRPGGGELPYRLRQSVKLAAGHEVGVDWVNLLDDLCRWDHPQKFIQKKWARSFFSAVDIEMEKRKSEEG